MTQNANPLRKDHLTNGTATDFLYDWQIDSAAELLVTKVNLLVTPNTEEILNSGFTVSGVGNISGGNVIISPALATGSKIVVTSNIPFNQTANFTDQNSVKPAEVMAMGDRLSRQIKKLAEQVSRAVLTTFADGLMDANTFLQTVLAYRNTASAAAATATTQAGIGTTQAGIATTKAAEAHADALAAAAALEGANFGLSTGRTQIITTGFTAGVTTVLPALTPDKPANEEAADIYFYNGTTYISQPAPDRYSYNFATGVFTLSDVVPAGTTKIVVKWWNYLAQGTVSDNSIDFLTKMISIAGDKVAGWIGGVATALDFNQNTALGTSQTTIPSEKVVSDALASVGGLVLIETQTASASPEIIFDDFDTETYSEFIVKFEDVAIQNGAYMYMRASDDAITYGTSYRESSFRIDPFNSKGDSPNQIYLMYNTAAAASRITGYLTITDPGDAGAITSGELYSRFLNGSVFTDTRGSWSKQTAAVTEAIKFYASTGNLISGIFRLYGIKK